jgi:hypothetical protein
VWNLVLLKPLEECAERRISFPPEWQHDIVARHLGLGIAPFEAKQAMRRYMFHPEMRRVFDPHDRASIMKSSERPIRHLPKRDGVRIPTRASAPGKMDAAVRDHDSAPSDHGLPWIQSGPEHCFSFGLGTARAFHYRPIPR